MRSWRRLRKMHILLPPLAFHPAPSTMDIMVPYKLAREINLNGNYETSTVHHQG